MLPPRSKRAQTGDRKFPDESDLPADSKFPAESNSPGDTKYGPWFHREDCRPRGLLDMPAIPAKYGCKRRSGQAGAFWRRLIPVTDFVRDYLFSVLATESGMDPCGGSTDGKAYRGNITSRLVEARFRRLRLLAPCIAACALSMMIAGERFSQATEAPAVTGNEVAAPKGDSAASAPRRVFLLGDNAFSAGSVMKILQSFFAARGEPAELREVPLRGKSLLEAAEAAEPENIGPQDVCVVFDHPLRLVVQRSPNQTANDLATLSERLPVRYVLSPSPLLNDSLYRERRVAAVTAAQGTQTGFIPLVGALKQAQSLAAGRPWQADLSRDRATLLTDYLTACLVYASVSGRSPQGLPADIPLDEETSLHVALDAAEVLQRTAEAVLSAGWEGESSGFDYDPGLQPPVQVFAAGSPIAVPTEGLQPLIVDWNGDGVHDLIAAGVKAGCGEVYLVQKTEAGFAAAAGTPLELCRAWAELQPQGVTLAQSLDWDANGTADLLLLTGRGEIWLAISPKTGEWSPPRPLAGPKNAPLRLAYATSAWAADLDQDDDVDLLLGDASGQVWIAWNGGNRAKEAFEVPQAVSIGGLELLVDHDAAAVAADWDCDSRLDLIVGSRNGAVYWCRGLKSEGRPGWAPPLTLVGPCSEESPAGTPQRPGAPLWTPVPGWSPRPAVADWNGDHWPDLFLGDSNRKVIKYREMTAEEEADLKAVLAQRESLLAQTAAQAGGPTPAQRAALLDLTLAVIEKSRDRRYERCGWLWYFERRPPAPSP